MARMRSSVAFWVRSVSSRWLGVQMTGLSAVRCAWLDIESRLARGHVEDWERALGCGPWSESSPP